MKDADEARYWEGLRLFLDASAKFPLPPVSTVLYGSLSRGSVRPGYSDLLDAVLVFEEEAFNDFQHYSECLDHLLKLCRDLKALQLPFHPFHYLFMADLRRHWPAFYKPLWQNPELSTILSGVDLRQDMQSTDQEAALVKALFFATRFNVQMRLSRFLAEPIPLAHNLVLVSSTIRRFLKTGAQLACFTLNSPSDSSEAIVTLAHKLPNILESRWEPLQDFVDAPIESQEHSAYEIAYYTLSLSEELHDEVLNWLHFHKGPEPEAQPAY